MQSWIEGATREVFDAKLAAPIIVESARDQVVGAKSWDMEAFGEQARVEGSRVQAAGRCVPSQATVSSLLPVGSCCLSCS